MNPSSSLAALLGAIAGIILLFFTLPFDVPYNLDFHLAYGALQRLSAGLPLYQLNPEQSLSTFFPYPPWYTLLLSPLSLLSPPHAAKVWALINVVFASTTTLLILRKHRSRTAIIALAWTLLCAPSQGHLIVGQYTLLSVFGAALAINSHTHRLPGATAFGLLLSTFKPHLGVPFVAGYGIWSFIRGDSLIFRTLLILTTLLLALLIVTECVAPGSLRDYPSHLATLSALSINQVCDTCSSVPVIIERFSPWHSVNVWQERAIIAGITGVTLLIPFLALRAEPGVFYSALVSTILLATPYNRNYDFVFMLIPWAFTLRLHLPASDTLEASAMPRRITPLITALFVTSLLTGGVLPYFLSREAQGIMLWLSPAATYLIALCSLQTPRRPLPN